MAEFAKALLSVFFNDTATTEIYTLSLHDALPICPPWPTSGSLRPPWTGCAAKASERRGRIHEEAMELDRARRGPGGDHRGFERGARGPGQGRARAARPRPARGRHVARAGPGQDRAEDPGEGERRHHGQGHPPEHQGG